MNKIIVQPLGGLCNRMRVIVGAASLAKKLGKRMVIVWTQDQSLNARFDELFEPIPYEVIETNLTSLSQRLRWKYLTHLRRCTVLDDTWIHENARGKDFSHWKDKVENNNILINSNLDILFDGDYSIFKAKESLLNEFNNVIIDKGVIGIHIRRTDNMNAVKFSPTKLFLEKMNEEISLNPTIRFYLATDDPKEENIFLKEYGERIIIYQKHSLDRNNPIAIKDAVVDLYNLSRCRKIYGSYYSSFSDTAALWMGIEKIELRTVV